MKSFLYAIAALIIISFYMAGCATGNDRVTVVVAGDVTATVNCDADRAISR